MRSICLFMAAALLPLLASFALAQPAPSQPPEQSRLDQLEQRFNKLEKQYQSDLKQRDEEIARLKTQLQQQAQIQPSSKPADAIEQQKTDILKEIDQAEAKRTERKGASFNPDFAVVGNWLGSWSDNKHNKALNRFDVGEVELDLRAAVDPRADGVLILSVARDAGNPLFQDEEVSGPETEIAAEEAYLFFHDFGVPNLTAKLGRFHLRFGRQNILHSHDLPTADSPFVNQAFLAPEALSDAGVSLSYVIPNPWNQYFELVTEVITGEGGSSESPTLNGDLSVDSPAINAHLLWNVDITKTWNLELGGSFLHGQHDISDAFHPDSFGDANLFGADVTLIHTDPTGGFFNQLIQGEMIYGLVDQSDHSRANSWGAYVLGQQQINKDWYVGIRGDWTEDANDSNRQVWGVSPYVSWYWSEFLRFRIEYQHKGGDVDRDTNIVYFQVTWIFAAHPPHPYWVMK